MIYFCLGTKSIFHVTYFADFWRICKILQKFLPVKTSPYNLVYINLSRYFQVTLASYWWTRILLNHWQNSSLACYQETYHRVQHSPGSFVISRGGFKLLNTKFDSGLCTKAYPLGWNSQEKYKNHIIMIGTLCLIMAYFKMIGKKNGCIWF